MFSAIEEIGARHGLEVAVVAHAGDGNLHPLLSVPKHPDDGGRAPAGLSLAADELVRTALRLGGTISGEHGVGITKRHWLETELGTDNLGLQRRLKRTFDPNGILNPHTWLAEETSVDLDRELRDISETASPSMTPATYGENRA